jgi:hypothetical protein
MSNNAYKDHGRDYIKQGYSATPAKYESKLPAIKEWTKYCNELPTDTEYLTWSNAFDKSNIDICLGSASGVIALDFDSTDPEIIDLIEHMMPSSPVQRNGKKGWVRFFKYSGEESFSLKYNGEVVVEILSNKKKVTIPPSMHPSGIQYTWEDKGLLDIDKDTLPRLPIGLIPELQNKLQVLMPGTVADGSVKLINGRNDALSSICGKIIQEGKSVSDALTELIKFDKENHEAPLFEDIQQWGHNEPFTNALTFYSNHLRSVNAKRFQKHQEYEVPVTASAVNETYIEEILKKKEQNKDDQKNIREKELFLNPPGALGGLVNYILQNSYVKQPAFALSASLSIMATLIGRKTRFQGVASNLYLLNIAGSGSGKDQPMQEVKNVLSEINAFYLLGAGDYVSDASLMDELATNPCRVDIIDEASGLLKGVTGGNQAYNGKMADILCELYTSSSSRFLGRMTAEGRKGMCDRPNVSLLCATTPTGFSESVNRKAIEKGLLGRFLIFKGESKQPANRITRRATLPDSVKETLLFWKNFEAPQDSGFKLGDVSQRVYDIQASLPGSRLLDQVFRKLDEERQNTPEDSNLLPIISRLYQQTLKIAMISACSRTHKNVPIVEKEDVEFAFQVVMYFRGIMEDVVENHIFSNETEAKYVKVYNLIKKSGEGISQPNFNDATRWLKPRERETIIRELINDKKIIAFHNGEGDSSIITYTTTE